MCRTFIRQGEWDPDGFFVGRWTIVFLLWLNQIQSSPLILIITAVCVTLYTAFTVIESEAC